MNRLLRFFVPQGAPHQTGEALASAFFGAEPARHVWLDWGVVPRGESLAVNNMHYGILYGGEQLAALCDEAGRNWIHVDHGHFDRSSSPTALDGYYRFSSGSQANRFRTPTTRDALRFRQLMDRGVFKLLPPISFDRSRFIAYQPPSQFMRDYYRLPPDFDVMWMRRAQDLAPDCEIKVVPKGAKDNAFYQSIGGFVSFNSTVAVECLQRGIPIMMTTATSWWDKEFTYAGREREVALAYLAGRNFMVKEMESGLALFHMIENGEIKLKGVTQ